MLQYAPALNSSDEEKKKFLHCTAFHTAACTSWW